MFIEAIERYIHTLLGAQQFVLALIIPGKTLGEW